MDYSNFDPADGDWEEDFSSELNWGESQWRHYLKGSENDTSRYLSLYNSLKNNPNHLDEVASLMGWDSQDLAMTDDEQANSSVEDSFTNTAGELHDGEDAPYTLHRHPIYIASSALYRYLYQSWEHFLAQNSDTIPAQTCWKYARSLNQAETNVLHCIQSLDLGDFGLAICHLKNSLSALNHSIALLDSLIEPTDASLESFRSECKIRLFDLRELWIRIIGDCRHEVRRRSNGGKHP